MNSQPYYPGLWGNASIGGTFYRGFGIRLNGSWTAPARVTASGAPGSSDLRFGSVLKIDGRLFVNFDQRKSIVEAVPFLKGARLAFGNGLVSHRGRGGQRGVIGLPPGREILIGTAEFLGEHLDEGLARVVRHAVEFAFIGLPQRRLARGCEDARE